MKLSSKFSVKGRGSTISNVIMSYSFWWPINDCINIKHPIFHLNRIFYQKYFFCDFFVHLEELFRIMSNLEIEFCGEKSIWGIVNQIVFYDNSNPMSRVSSPLMIKNFFISTHFWVVPRRAPTYHWVNMGF